MWTNAELIAERAFDVRLQVKFLVLVPGRYLIAAHRDCSASCSLTADMQRVSDLHARRSIGEIGLLVAIGSSAVYPGRRPFSTSESGP